MRKFLIPSLLLAVFWTFAIVRGDGDVPSQLVASAAEFIPSPDLLAVSADQFDLNMLPQDYLKNESFAVTGILLASIVLALRRRAHLVFGRPRR
ncbi:MAG: hypothetical protein ACKVHP_11835 [Verrucomicrobiales bacterium]